jgi:hypothetical protein
VFIWISGVLERQIKLPRKRTLLDGSEAPVTLPKDGNEAAVKEQI